MPGYLGSKASIALGSTLSIGDGAQTQENFTAVAELSQLETTGRQMATDDVTNFESTQREKIATIFDPGKWTFSGKRVGSDAGLVAMETALQTGATHNFKVQLPKAKGQTTTGDLYAFAAIVTEINYTFPADKASTVTGTIDVTGPVTMTAGS
jgi:hypothetical protein